MEPIVIAFLLLAFLAFVFLLLAMVSSVKVALLVVLVVVTFVDLLRRFLGNEVLLLGLIDTALLLACFFFYMPYLMGWRNRLGVLKEMPPLLRLSLGLYIGVIIVEAFTTNIGHWLLALAGLRSYLLAIPMIGIGWYVAKTWKLRDYQGASIVILFLTMCAVLFAAFQLFIPPSVLGPGSRHILTPMGHAFHSFGYSTVELSSSFFATSKRFGRYLLFMYPFVWAYLSSMHKRRESLYLFLIFSTGLVMSGSREAMALFLFFHAAIYAATKVRKLLGYAVVLGIVVLAILMIYPSSYPEAEARGLFFRLRFFISSPGDWISRVNYMIAEPIKAVLSGEGGWTLVAGRGVGTYGQELQLLNIDPTLLIAGAGRGVADSGIVKILTELGALGLLAFVMLQGSILSYARFLRPKGHVDPFFLAALLGAFMWVILFLKGHPVISDQMMNFFYWFYVGLLVSRARAEKIHGL